MCSCASSPFKPKQPTSSCKNNLAAKIVVKSLSSAKMALQTSLSPTLFLPMLVSISVILLNGATAKEDKAITPPKVASACEGTTMNLSCDSSAGDYVLNILTNTMYGRFSIVPCNNGTTSGWSTKCNTSDAVRVVRDLCQGKRACNILASNATFTAQDPCPETLKYLEVKYTCVRKEPPTESPLSFQQQKLVSPLQPFMPNNNNDFADNMPKYGSGSSSAGFDFNVNSNNNNMCPETTSEAGIVWPQTARGNTVYRQCPNGVDSHAQWRCLDQSQPRWDPAGPDFSPCGGNNMQSNSPEQFCTPVLMGGVTWPRAAPGVLAVMPCPFGAKGSMRWRCSTFMSADQTLLVDWDRRGPDATECESSWVQTIDSQGITPDNVLPIIERTAEKTQAGVVGTAAPIQFGRDLKAIVLHLAAVQRTAEIGLQSGQLSADRTRNLSLALIRASSAVLDARNAEAWRDLRRHDASASATRLLDTLERHASMMTALSPQPNGLEKTVSKNVFVGSGRFSTSVGAPIGLFFQPTTRDSDEWPSEFDQIQLPRNLLDATNKTHETFMLPISFVAYNNIGRYLGTKLADQQATASLQQLTSRMPMTTLMPYNSNNNSMLILPNNYPPLFYEPLLMVNSRVISASMQQQQNAPTSAAAADKKPSTLAEPVIVRLEHLAKNQRGTPMCVYWAYQYGGAGLGYEAAWSRDGCSVVQTSRDFTVCSCSHLGSFAVLFDVNGFFSTPSTTTTSIGRNDNMLLSDSRGFSQLVTWTAFGYLLAIVCLVLTLISLNCYKFSSSRLTKTTTQSAQLTETADDAQLKTFHKHFVFCLICGHVIFLLTVIDRTYLRTGGACEAAGMVLHWFYLAVFIWMLMETAHLYTEVTNAYFDGASTTRPTETRRKKWYCYALAAAYGVPTLAVVLAVAVSGGSWKSYAAERYCLLRIDSLAVLLGFIAPALSALVFTWLLIAICFYILTKKTKSRAGTMTSGHQFAHLQQQQQQQRGMQTIKCWLFSIAVLSSFLGAAWTTGLLYLRTDAIALAYLFVGFNTLLGIMVFVMHVLRDDKVCRKLQRFSSLRFFFFTSPNSSASSRWTAAAVAGGAHHPVQQHCSGVGSVGGGPNAQQWLCNSQQSSPSSAYSSGTGVAGQQQLQPHAHDMQMMKNIGTANSDTATMIYGGSMWNNQLADLAAALPPHHHPHMHHHAMCHAQQQQQQLPPSLLMQQQQQRDRDSGVSCPSSQRESPPTTTTVATNNSNGLALVSATSGCGCCCTSNYCGHVHAAAAMHHQHQHQPSSTNGGECPYRIGGSEAAAPHVVVGNGSVLYSDHEHIYQEIPNHYNMHHHQCNVAGGNAMHPPLPLANGMIDAAAHRTMLLQQQQIAAAVRQRLAAAANQQQQQKPLNPNETASSDAEEEDDNDEVCSTEPSQSEDESNTSSCDGEPQHHSSNINPVAAAAAARARARTGIATRAASQRHRSGGANVPQQQQLKQKKSLPLPPTIGGLPQQQLQSFLQQNHAHHQHHSLHHQHQNSGGIYQPQSTCSCSSDACSTTNNTAAAAANNAAAVAAAAAAAARNRFQTAAANAASSRFHSPHRTNNVQSRSTPQHFNSSNNSATVSSQHIPACFPLAATNSNGNSLMMPGQQQPDFRQSFLPNNNNNSSFAPLSYANTLPHHAQNNIMMPQDAEQPHYHHHQIFNQNDMMMNSEQHQQAVAAAAHLAQLHHFQQQNRLSAAISNGTLHQMHHPAQHQNFLSNSTMHLANAHMSKLALPSMATRQHSNNNSNGLSFSEC